MDGSERAAMLGAVLSGGTKLGLGRGQGGIPLPTDTRRPGGNWHSAQASSPQTKKKKKPTYLLEVPGHAMALRLPQLFLNVIEITESCFHELILNIPYKGKTIHNMNAGDWLSIG